MAHLPDRLNMRVQLIRKLAESVDGIDLSHCRVGDVIDLTLHDARLLIAEGWAVATTAPDVTCVAEAKGTLGAKSNRPRPRPRRS